jgi:hypothetical protein
MNEINEFPPMPEHVNFSTPGHEFIIDPELRTSTYVRFLYLVVNTLPNTGVFSPCASFALQNNAEAETA